MSLHIVILAAGYGKRMFSKHPKVLQLLAGKPLLQHVVDTALLLKPEAIHVVYGQGGEAVQQALAGSEIHWVWQQEQLGTGHAVSQALPFIPEEGQLLVLSGDVPLIQKNTLEALVKAAAAGSLGLLLATLENPSGLGRIVRDVSGNIQAIVEEKDATEQQKSIKEIYTGICAAKADLFKRFLPKIVCNNAQNEYYLTDVITLAAAENLPIV